MSDPARWAVGVVVPARDEADTVSACVHAIRRSLDAADHAGAHIVVVADRCDDDTVALAEAALGDAGEVLHTGGRNVGLARRLGTDLLTARFAALGIDPARTWLASTDADSLAPRDWVSCHLRLADAGAAAVAGVVRVDSFEGHPPEVRERYLLAYAAEPVVAPGRAAGQPAHAHGHVHGANLGVRGDAYLAVGGWSALTTAEDHDLWHRLCRSGWQTTASREVWVTTSGRLVGRAPDGFAGHLRSLERAP